MLKQLFDNHPKGLYLLFFVEMWERFSYYGMRALLVLFMIQKLLYSTEDAGIIYGLYTGFVYLTPLIGGYIADRYIGQRRCISIGATLMSIGLLILALASEKLFIFALILMVIANGFFKSNISSLLGILYSDTPEKKDSGFTIFYMGINLGAFLSPLICGTIAVKYGFEWGFMSAGIGMIIGLITYKVFENKILNNVGITPYKTNEDKLSHTTPKLTDIEKKRIYSLFTLMGFTIVFWTCYEQAGSSLTLFAEYSTNRYILGFHIPTEYFQALNPLFIIILAPLMSTLWSKLERKNIEPDSVEKFTIALSLMSISYIIMAFAGNISLNSIVSPIWLIVAYLIMTVSELCISPIGLSLVSKLAPRQFLSILMGTWFLTSFFGNIFAGIWGGKYGTIRTDLLFLTLAMISLVSAIILMNFIPKLRQGIGKL